MTKAVKQNVKSFIKDYKVAAFARSSRFLIKDVIKELPTQMTNVVEHGAGDGVMSIEILKKLGKNGKLVLVEQNKDFLQILRKIDDKRVKVWAGNAEEFPYEKFFGEEKIDLVISSIPFSFLKKTDRDKIVKYAKENLSDSGKFIVFHQYSLLMNDVVKKYFKTVKNKFVARNFFPCFIIIGKK